MPERYPLEELLDVRRFREEAAERDARLARERVQEAKRDLEEKTKALDAWRRWREEEVERRYAAILGKRMTIEKLDAFNRSLAALALEEVALAQALDEARARCAELEKAFEAAKAAAKRARKNTAKIEAHRNIWREEAKKAAERAADLEFEDFRPVVDRGASAENEN